MYMLCIAVLFMIFVGNLQGMDDIGTTSKTDITPDSFNDTGKSILMGYVCGMQEAAKKRYPIITGLAAICNSIPATEEGIHELIHDAPSLLYANEYNDALAKTAYSNLNAYFYEIRYARFAGSEQLSLDTMRTLTSILLYPTLCHTTDFRMPTQNMGMAFMGTDIKTNRRVLKFNRDMDPIKNATSMKAAALLMAYCSQQFIGL